jgi:hypothetical protein
MSCNEEYNGYYNRYTWLVNLHGFLEGYGERELLSPDTLRDDVMNYIEKVIVVDDMFVSDLLPSASDFDWGGLAEIHNEDVNALAQDELRVWLTDNLLHYIDYEVVERQENNAGWDNIDELIEYFNWHLGELEEAQWCFMAEEWKEEILDATGQEVSAERLMEINPYNLDDAIQAIIEEEIRNGTTT